VRWQASTGRLSQRECAALCVARVVRCSPELHSTILLMMTALHGVVMSSFWFRIKLILLGLIVLNAVITLMPAGKKLRMLLASAIPVSMEEVTVGRVRGRMRLFYLLQFLFFLLIFILSVFQPT